MHEMRFKLLGGVVPAAFVLLAATLVALLGAAASGAEQRDGERGYGVSSGDGNPKPAYCALAAALEVSC